MTIRRKLIGPCCDPASGPLLIVDADAVVRRLLLFDTYVLQSDLMRELPTLASLFGISGLETLLKSGALRIQCDAVTLGQIGQTTDLEVRRDKGALPLCSFSLAVVRAHDQGVVVSNGLANVLKTPGSLKEVIRLKRSIVDALEQPPAGFGLEALHALPADLQNEDLLCAAVVRGMKEVHGSSIPLASIEARAIQIDAYDFRIETNAGQLLSLNEVQTHTGLERAVLAMGDLNFRVEQMKAHAALSGSLRGDIQFFEKKLGFLARELDPQCQQDQFVRVMELRGFPGLVPGVSRIDVDRLMRARSSSECQEFREWLQTTDGLTDKQVVDLIAGYRARLDSFVQSVPGKALRLAVSTALGMTPDHGVLAGVVAGTLDAFVVDKLFGASGPALFVNRTYPSIFRSA